MKKTLPLVLIICLLPACTSTYINLHTRPAKWRKNDKEQTTGTGKDNTNPPKVKQKAIKFR